MKSTNEVNVSQEMPKGLIGPKGQQLVRKMQSGDIDNRKSF